MEFTHKPNGEKIVIMTAKEYLELLQWAASEPTKDDKTSNETPLSPEHSTYSMDDEDDEGPISLDWLVDTTGDNPWDDPYATIAPRWEAINDPNIATLNSDHSELN